MSLFASPSSSSVASASIPRRQLWSALTASSSRALSTTPSRQAKPRRNTGKNPFDLAPWEAFQHDDVPTLGHEVLNRGRELLRYARTVEHELPNLEKLRQPYNPPPSSSVLTFRSMHYQGAPHPANRKSVLTVSLPDLYAHSLFTSLPDDSTRIRTLRKLLHLAGPRWNPGKGPMAEPLRLDGKYGEDVTVRGEIKISCEKFPTERQNMKWCSDVFDEMIKEAQRLDDGIADLPIDVRHALSRETKKAHHGRRRQATIADWPASWATPVKASQGEGTS
ncbi:hypothetical protein BCV69DRAFT_284278 [Microstroma glucosiphilum]|uniref:Small ribosomal subunit protein mS35 mitochondrial conserved domain-containing protein n=1 Tax=Pseudomicrostroma glucosiphilum TaxID=1684307 RepID=A0A316U1P8_9BASI|nr:hypothetical protein BCV69DRAFT_284278 [Pseudomicrostroma glucosiphilum]PWN19120.1 hypothetical protein BCV69DRAFT_284278 [Pseudomicrostroma glucosiphilum]